MKFLAFCLLLGMSAQGQEPKIVPNAYHFANYVDCDLVLPKVGKGTAQNCKIQPGHTLDDVVNQVADVDRLLDDDFAAQRAADETDGKPQLWSWPDGKILWIDPKVDPHKPWDEVNEGPISHICGRPQWYGAGYRMVPCPPADVVPAEPVDVPAVQETRNKWIWIANCWSSNGTEGCKWPEVVDTCADKSRVLLTSEDGKKHCVKF